jgi:hypothetical protein
MRGRDNLAYIPPTDPSAGRGIFDQHFISGGAIGHEHHPAINTAKTVATGNEFLNCDVF